MDLQQSDSSRLIAAKGRFRLLAEVGIVSAKLGLTSFGGPIAHLGYFHEEYIRRRKWMSEQDYAELVALCQFLPGPASSQVGIGIGVIRAGMLGGVVAWLGFTLPSVILLILFALLLKGFDLGNAGWLHGLKIVAVAIVAQAVYTMGQKLTHDRIRATLAVAAASFTLLWPTAWSQITIIVAAAMLGFLLYRKKVAAPTPDLHVPINRSVAAACLLLFAGLLLLLPLLRQMMPNNQWFAIADSFYRTGSFVFGGGHVVLPLLEKEVVPIGWISKQDFLTGYGATQAVPGPLFTFAGYLGAMIKGVGGAALATFAIFLPAFLLIIGALPFWNSLRKSHIMRGALMGVNAAVVGILLAALYNPIWTSAIVSSIDFVLAIALLVLLVYWKLPPWMIVIAGALSGALIF